MNKKTNAILLVALGIGIVACLHLLIFAPLKQRLDDQNQEMQRLQGAYGAIVRSLPSAGDSGNIMDRNTIASNMQEIIETIKTKIDVDQKSFEQMDSQMKIIEHFEPNVVYQDQVLAEIEKTRQLEQNSAVTKLKVTDSWGVNEGITEGRFGTGFYAAEKRAMTYANLTTRRIIDPKQGTVEFYVKPDWDPNDVEIHHKALFMAIHVEKMTREQLQQIAEGIVDERGQKMNLQMVLPAGPGPFPVESMVAVYKGEGPTLVFELKDFLKPASTVTAVISDWKKGQWYHIGAIWEAKKQALYVNGQNKGNPFGGSLSIRSARDVEDELLLGGDMGGMGMGMMGMGGMGMGMGGMGMGMGMGMGGMGMGMGGMGMGMGGMGGGGGFGGARFGATGGTTLTQGIALPTTLSGIYLGTDDEGGFGSDAVFDDLRILSSANTAFNLNTELARTDNTLMIDHFDNDLPAPEDLPALLKDIEVAQRNKNLPAIADVIRDRYNTTYKVLKHALGINTNYYGDHDATKLAIRELYVMDFIRKNANLDFDTLRGYMEIKTDPQKDNVLHYRITEFQKFCYDLAEQAVQSKVIAINKVVYKGQSYNVTDDELRNYFRSEMTAIRDEYMGPDNMLVRYGAMGGGGGYGMGMMGMGGMGMGGMGMGGMGMGMMGMGGMGMGMGMANMGVPLYDPDTGDQLTKDQAADFWEKYEGLKTTLKTYNKYDRDGLIPPEVLAKYNKQQEDANTDFYIKRAVQLDVDSDYKSALLYFYNIEYGPRFNTINNIVMTHKEGDVVNILLDVESHYLKGISDDEVVATAATAGETAGDSIGGIGNGSGNGSGMPGATADTDTGGTQ